MRYTHADGHANRANRANRDIYGSHAGLEGDAEDMSTRQRTRCIVQGGDEGRRGEHADVLDTIGSVRSDIEGLQLVWGVGSSDDWRKLPWRGQDVRNERSCRQYSRYGPRSIPQGLSRRAQHGCSVARSRGKALFTSLFPRIKRKGDW